MMSARLFASVLAIVFASTAHGQNPEPSLSEVRASRFESVDEKYVTCEGTVTQWLKPCVDFRTDAAFTHIGFETAFGKSVLEIAEALASDVISALACETYDGLEGWGGEATPLSLVSELIMWQHRSPTFCPDGFVLGQSVLRLARRGVFAPDPSSSEDSRIQTAFEENKDVENMLSIELQGVRSGCVNSLHFVFAIREDMSFSHCKIGATNIVQLMETGPILGEAAKYVQVEPISRKAPSTTDASLEKSVESTGGLGTRLRTIGVVVGVILAALGAFAMFRMGRPTSK